jgi:membrane-associated phospholipid phosphatase
VRFATIVCVASFAAVATAVAFGGFTGIDQWSLDHAMPWLSPIARPAGFASNFLPFTRNTPSTEIPAELWLFPASAPISALLVAGCCSYLWRRGQVVKTVAWSAAWVVGNVVEVVGKDVIRRPALHLSWRGRIAQMPTFDDSFPSGHALRALLVAALLASVWPRVRPAIALWLTMTLSLLVATNAHTPSDVFGGVLVGVTLALICIRLGTATTRVATSARVLRSSVRSLT